MTLVGVVGAGGFGRECLRLVRAHASQMPGPTTVVFVEENPKHTSINATPVVSFEEFCANDIERVFSVAIADSGTRERLANTAIASGAKAFSVIAKTAIVGDGVTFGEGAILHDNTMLTADSTIGRFFHCNYYSFVPHDCTIGDFVTFGPGVRLGGNVIIGDHAYIGAGAMVRQGTVDKPVRIGKGAVVGMGAVVLTNVPDGAIVAGVPAKRINGRS